jgi:hypothetical protein
VHETPEGPVIARADDQKVERRAVQRQLLGRVAVGGVRLDALERRDTLAGVLDRVLDRLFDRCRAPGRARE